MKQLSWLILFYFIFCTTPTQTANHHKRQQASYPSPEEQLKPKKRNITSEKFDIEWEMAGLTYALKNKIGKPKEEITADILATQEDQYAKDMSQYALSLRAEKSTDTSAVPLKASDYKSIPSSKR